ncbi:MAG: radical SAM protein [Nanoarchaeota archaeon]
MDSNDKYFHSHNYLRKPFSKKETVNFINELKNETDKIIKSVNWKDYLIVILGCSYGQLFPSLYAAKLIKKLNPSIKICVYGNLIFKEYGNYILNEFRDIDFIFSGEDEKTFYKLIYDIINNRKPNKNINNFKNHIKLDQLPFTDYKDFFEKSNLMGIEQNSVMVYTSRGCPYNKCTFCNINKQCKNYRIKSVNKIADEIAELQNRYHQIKQFCFADSMISEIYLIKLAKEILKRKIRSSFNFLSRATLKGETIELLSEAGFDRIQIGLEALDQNILNRINKGIKLTDSIEIIKNLQLFNIKSETNIITGFLNVEKKDILNSIRILKKLKYYPPFFNIRLRYSFGSEEYKNLIESGSYLLADNEMRNLLYPNISKYDTFFPITPKKNNNEGEWKSLEIHLRKGWFKKRFTNSLPGIYYKQNKKKILVYFNYDKKLVATEVFKNIDKELFHLCNSFKSINEIKEGLPKYSEKEIKKSIKRLINNEILIDVDNNYMTLPINLEKWVKTNHEKER